MKQHRLPTITLTLLLLTMILLLGTFYNSNRIIQNWNFYITNSEKWKIFHRITYKYETSNALKKHRSEFSNFTIQEIDSLNAAVNTPGDYKDMKGLNGCKPPSLAMRKDLFRAIKWWMGFAAKHNITWFITYGTLIGSLRHGDIVPWDTDVDFGIFKRDEPLLRRLQTPRGHLSSIKCNLILRPGSHCLFNGPKAQRQTCSGKLLCCGGDQCAFCGPVARVWYRADRRIDLFIYDYHITNNSVHLYDEGLYDHTQGKVKYTDYSTILPLKRCQFMGLVVPCPNQGNKYVKIVYKSTKPTYKCYNKKWLKPRK